MVPEPVRSARLFRRQDIDKTSKRNAMINFAAPGDVQIDRTHNAAIRREIGDRFRIALNAERLPLTPALLDLLDRMADRERRSEARRGGAS